MLINLASDAVDVAPALLDGGAVRTNASARCEWRVTGGSEGALSRTVLLNGAPLERDARTRELPATLDPECVDGDAPVHLAPQSYAFVLLPDAAAKRCY